MMASPLVAVLMLRDLGLGPRQYGLSLGLTCLGGVLGSRLTPLLTRRFGQRRILLVSGVARTFWTILLLAPSGALGVFTIVAADFGLLFAAGVFNTSFTTYRMEATPDGFMSRVGTSWSVGSKTSQAAFMIAGGLIAKAAGVRGALLIAGLLCMASALLLPWSKACTSTGDIPAPAAEPVPSQPQTPPLRSGFPSARLASSRCAASGTNRTVVGAEIDHDPAVAGRALTRFSYSRRALRCAGTAGRPWPLSSGWQRARSWRWTAEVVLTRRA